LMIWTSSPLPLAINPHASIDWQNGYRRPLPIEQFHFHDGEILSPCRRREYQTAGPANQWTWQNIQYASPACPHPTAKTNAAHQAWKFSKAQNPADPAWYPLNRYAHLRGVFQYHAQIIDHNF